ncbi:MAG: Fe-S cluster assembly protein SufD [Bryobacteraceae bacterium]
MTAAPTSFLERLREEARQRFSELGYPDTHNEDWRFTSVAPIARTKFVAGAPADGWSQEQRGDGYVINFYNGHPLPESSKLPRGVEVTTLGKVLRTRPELLEPHLGRYASYQNDAFVALNTAEMQDGAFIQIAKGVVVDAPIYLNFVSMPGKAATVSHPRNLILTGPDSQATIIESYVGGGDHTYFTNPVTEIVAGDHAVIDHYKFQVESEQAFHVATMQVQVGRDTNFSSHSIAFGGGLVRNDVNAVLSEGSECTLNGLYLVHGDQHIDNHTAIDHAKPHAASHELYKGILDGKSSAVFNGKILVRKDAQKTDAKQTNKNLVLSENAVIDTKPELQIHADDVRCTHGATIGQLDPEGVFYLQSRGIGVADAKNLLIYAFARDMVDRVKVEALREQLEQILLEKLRANRG